jgi:hypothetical protein
MEIVSDSQMPKLGICRTSALLGFGIYAFGIPRERARRWRAGLVKDRSWKVATLT